ncbi:MAG: MFS transporter [Candidatus Sumerlaeaceae bacterium]|nr:MFS transporter [Candidatus Sumerlaeaceae bacterium]
MSNPSSVSSTDGMKRHRGFAAFRYSDFRKFELARVLFVMSWQMQGTAVAWQVFSLTGSALALGFIGLVQFIPAVLFILVTGHVADRHDRRLVVATCMAVLSLIAGTMAWLTYSGQMTVHALFVLIFLIGVAHAFAGPASQALLPHLVPKEVFSNAVAWNSSLWQFASIAGPALGGLLIGIFGGPAAVYLVDCIFSLVAATTMVSVRTRLGRMDQSPVSLETLLAGFRYVWQQKVVLGAITLDLFAVLFGGAVALLPIYAKEILHVGAFGFGLLRAAPSVGAGLMAVVFAHLPPMRHAGRSLFLAVTAFGVFTIIFGISHNFYLSLAALMALGAADMVSVVIRHTAVQLVTPPEMRGRVSAVNLIFIGASNQLGEFESGLTAHWFGTVPAVVLGGLGTLLVVATCAAIFPELRQLGRLDQIPEPSVAHGSGSLKPVGTPETK